MAQHPWASQVRRSATSYSLSVLADLPALRRIHNLCDPGSPEIEALLMRAVTRSLAWIRTQVVERTPVGATGRLRGSVETSVDIRGTRPVRIIGEVSTNMIYALPVEMGTRPHRPPIEPLVYWAMRKLQLSEAAARGAAYAIAAKISRRGTRAQAMFQTGFASAIPYVNAQFEMVADELERLINSA